MKKLAAFVKLFLYRLFVESEWDEMNRKREEAGKPPFISW